MAAAAEILARHDELRELRLREEPVWRSLARLFVPDEQEFESRNRRREDDRADLFDSTPLYALENFTGGLFGQMTNPASRWVEFGVEGDDDLAQFSPVKRYLWQLGSVFYGSVAPEVSAFYPEIPSAFANAGVFGLGCLHQEERVGKGIVDRSLPIGQLFIDKDADGNIDTVDREYCLRGRHLKKEFGYGGVVDDARDYVIVHAVRPNPDFTPGAFGLRGKAFLSTYCSPDLPDLRVDGGYYELPYHFLAWKSRAGHVWPVGPGHSARPDSASLQEMERSHLVAAQFSAEPPILLHDDSVLTAADIAPNAVLTGTISDNGKRLLDVLERRQGVQLSLEQSNQRREAIKTAFFYGLMQLASRPQMTATEFLGFQSETLRLMAPNLVRMQVGLSSFIARRLKLLGRAGQLPPPPPELARARLKVVYVSPLAKAMKAEAGRGVLQLAQATAQVALLDPGAKDRFDGDAAMKVLGDAFTAAPDLIRDDQAVAEIRKQRAGVMAQQQQLANAGQAADIAATVSHAAQASSLAEGRAAA